MVAGFAWMLAAHASAEPVAAQEPAGAREPVATQAPDICADGRIAEVVIDNHSVFDLSDPDRGGRFAWAFRMANGFHSQTRADVLSRELLFAAGDCYQMDVLRDSERLLRAFGFIADANIYGIRLPDGDVQVRVDTRDEWSTRIEPTFASDGAVGLRGLRLVEDNVFGTGQHVGVFYEREKEEAVFGISYYTPQLFDTRWDLRLGAARTEVGHSYHQSFFYPFVGETGRVAVRQAIDRQDRYFELLRPGPDDEIRRIWVPVSRELFEVGAAFRWGRERYRHTMLGAAVAGERVRYPDEPSFADGNDAGEPVGTLQLPAAWTPVSSVRLMMVTGQRNVHFVRRRSIDTINGNEDIRLGVEAEASFGPTLPLLSDDRDVAIGLRLFAAGETAERFIIGGTFSFEGRRAYEAIDGLPEWHDMLGELDLWAYLRPSPDSRHTWVTGVSALGGWHSRVPFQLSLGGVAGLRGHPWHLDPGGRRIVGSVEHRTNLGWPFPELLDLGTVTFVDVGQIWPGNAPFGEGSSLRASVGAGIRAAFPPGSRQTFRLDVGFPVERGTDFRDLTVSIGVGQAIGRTARRDPQIYRSTRYGVSMTDFEYMDQR